MIDDNHTVSLNSIKINKASFSEAIKDGLNIESENLPAKSRALDSGKALGDEKPKKKLQTGSSDLFRDLSDMQKSKR